MSNISSNNTNNIQFTDSGIVFHDSLTRKHVNNVLADFYAGLQGYKGDYLALDLSSLTEIDSAGAATLFHIKKYCARNKIQSEIINTPDELQEKLKLLFPEEPQETKKIKEQGFFERIGEKTRKVFTDNISNYIRLTADVFYWSLYDLFRRKHYRKGEMVRQALKIGVSAVPIVTVMTFIIGLVLALQSAAQLRNFGANIYIVDLIVIAMMSEMGPLITAILVAGRSGSAIAAEIATMKVTAELDALKTMGLNPLRFIVVPKMYGSLLTIPFLTILASVAGIIGGLTTAYFYLDVTPEIFYNRIGNALYNKDIITGIVKSIVFSVLIVLTGSYYGLLVDRGAEGVGRVTTRSVVISIALVIVADSLMSLIFY